MTGSRSYYVPTGMAQKSTYRVRMTDYYNKSIMAYSEAFTIAGIAADTYEDDNVVADAKPITVDGSAQTHTLTRYDYDWCTFNAVAKNVYVIETTDSLYTRVRLYATNGATQLATDAGSGQGSNAKLTWYCATSGAYYFRVENSSSSRFGYYGLSVTEYDSTQYRFTVSSPAAASSYGPGNLVTVTWASSVLMSGYVDIFLYKGTTLVQNIAVNQLNDGTQPWTVPAGLAAGSDYQVKVAHRTIPEVYGYSASFSLTQ
jgi:hypothetical protein